MPDDFDIITPDSSAKGHYSAIYVKGTGAFSPEHTLIVGNDVKDLSPLGNSFMDGLMLYGFFTFVTCPADLVIIAYK